MEGGREQNYWPGFVDALSNVVLTLVFVLVVFVFALSMSANKVEKRMQEVLKAEAEFKAKNESKNMAAVEAGSGESEQTAVQSADKSVEIVAEEKQAMVRTNRGALTIENGSDRLVVHYPLSVVEMDPQTQASLESALLQTKAKAGNYKILLRSVTGKEPYSVAQRLAYYRALGLRNYLIAKGIGTNANITSKVVQSDASEKGYVEIIFQSAN